MTEQATLGASGSPGVPVELTRFVVGEHPLGEVLRRVAQEGVKHIPQASQVSVTLLDRKGSGRSVAFTGDLAAVLDERQYDDGFGPCMDAAQSGISVSVADTSAPDQLYPDYVAVARRRGVTSSVSSGLTTSHVMDGINVYCTDGRPLAEETVRLTQEFADVATAALANAALHEEAVAEAEHLRTAMESRAVIEQAKGIVMALHGCDAEEAFRQLSRTSQNANRKLRDVAADLVNAARSGELTR
ncbi:ANTAR domain-containing protein [Kineococcus rubinsiae]|uniref:ANTAR domain-containing protein n=1 Tax=Kineococcus rubinsiae TaxID=2609562 RepID=UPI0014304FEB|nr:ANTAR domain-containing protein [Kineococcus rubinsiae]NIZ93369.1 ANTAR domain-containing protein [Kineococcus rubinsiae]